MVKTPRQTKYSKNFLKTAKWFKILGNKAFDENLTTENLTLERHSLDPLKA
jgi:hypothetical protein